MTKRSALQLQDELERVLGYFRIEGRLSLAEVIGVLEIIKTNIFMESQMEELLDEEEGEQE